MIDFGRHVKALSMIHELYAHSREPRVVDEANRLWPDEEAQLRYGAGGMTTAGAYVQLTEARLARVFVAGIETQAHSIAVARGYMDAPKMREVDGANTAFHVDADQLVTRFLQPFIDTGWRVEFYGHSAGGAVVEIAAKILKDRNPLYRSTVATYGAPMPGFPGCWLPDGEVSRERFMNQDDPVPWIPFYAPSTGQLVVVYMVNPYFRPNQNVIAEPWRCRMPGGGIRILGRFAVRAHTPALSAGIQERIQAWFDRDTAPLNAHDAGTYLVAMRSLRDHHPQGLSLPGGLRVRGEIVAAEPRVVIGFPLPGHAANNVVMALEIKPAGVAIDTAGNVIGETTLLGGRRMFLKLGPSLKFKPVKVGSAWQVQCMGITLMQSDDKKTPKTFCKYANRMFSSIGDTNTLWLASFLEAITQLTNVAAVDDTKCRPTMRVDF